MSALDRVAWPIRTERLLLRPAVRADARASWEVRKHPQVREWITGAPERVEDFVTMFCERPRLEVTVMIERDGQLVGDLMLAVRDAWSQLEVTEQAHGQELLLGWTLHPDFQGQGLATEAVAEALRIGFEDLGVRRAVAECFADNTASWRLMERLGMRREGHAVRDSLHRDRGWLDGYTYALLEEEWRASLGA